MATVVGRAAVSPSLPAAQSGHSRRTPACAAMRTKHTSTATRGMVFSFPRVSLRHQRVAPARRESAVLQAAVDAAGDSVAGGKEAPDFGLVLKWLGATALQFALIQLALRGLQYVLTSTPLAAGEIPRVVVSLLFAFMALRSRVFSPLDNSRFAARWQLIRLSALFRQF